jgi:hypothetical protein
MNRPVIHSVLSSRLPSRSAHHRVPAAYLIGAAKSATTTLANALELHPRIALGRIKEPNFFSHPASFREGWDWYSGLYADARPDQLALDASTGYTQWPHFPDAAARLHHYAPEARLIYLMRHPVDRAYSHYVHRWSKERYPGRPFEVPFEEYITEDPLCVDCSDYRAQIQTYLQFFPNESLLCLFTADLESDPMRELQRICQFLDIDPSPLLLPNLTAQGNRADEFLESRIRIRLTDQVKAIPGVDRLLRRLPKWLRDAGYQSLRRSRWGRRVSRAFTPPPMQPATRRQLIERFADSNAWVAEHTGRDLTSWYH